MGGLPRKVAPESRSRRGAIATGCALGFASDCGADGTEGTAGETTRLDRFSMAYES